MLALTGAMSACGQAPSDVMAPTGSASGALTGPLHTVTLITPDWEPIQNLFVRGMGLTDQGLVQPAEDLAATQRALWGIPEDVSLRLHMRVACEGYLINRLLDVVETPLEDDALGRRLALDAQLPLDRGQPANEIIFFYESSPGEPAPQYTGSPPVRCGVPIQ